MIQIRLGRPGLILLPIVLLMAACTSQVEGLSEEQRLLSESIQNLSVDIGQISEQVILLHDSTHEFEKRLGTLENAQKGLVFDAARVGPSRAEYLPNPPDGLVTVQFVAEVENASFPGVFNFHLAPEGTVLFETLSLSEGEELITGPKIADGIAFVEPGVLYSLQVVFDNPLDEEVHFLVRGGVLDPQAALPFVRNRCWCAAIPFSVPANGTFSRIIEVGVGPDTPPGAKAVVVFPVVQLIQ